MTPVPYRVRFPGPQQGAGTPRLGHHWAHWVCPARATLQWLRARLTARGRPVVVALGRAGGRGGGACWRTVPPSTAAHKPTAEHTERCVRQGGGRNVRRHTLGGKPVANHAFSSSHTTFVGSNQEATPSTAPNHGGRRKHLGGPAREGGQGIEGFSNTTTTTTTPPRRRPAARRQ